MGARSPCANTKPQSFWHIFSCFCIQKCPSNGSINIETLIKILNLKDKRVGSELAACSVLCCFRVKIWSSYSLVGGSKGTNPDPRALTDNTGRWCALLTSVPAHTEQPSRAISSSSLPLEYQLGQISKRGVRREHVGLTGTASTGYFVFLAFFLSFLCVPLLPQICIQISPDFLNCSTVALQTFPSWGSLPLCSLPAQPPSLWSSAEARAEAAGVNEHHMAFLLPALSLSHMAGQGHTWALEQ